MTEPRVEAGDRALETARTIVKITKYEIARCGKDIYDNTSRVYGCCRPEGHDGPHETLEDRHVGRYTQETENKKYAEAAALIQSAMNAQERELVEALRDFDVLYQHLSTRMLREILGPNPQTLDALVKAHRLIERLVEAERLLAERGEKI